MKILGQFPVNSKKGELIKLTKPIEVFLIGDTLREKDGNTVAIRDCYGDWVSRELFDIGVKSIMEVIE